MPVRSLKAAGFSWSIEASISMGVRHFWQYSAGCFFSFAIWSWKGGAHIRFAATDV